MALGHAEPFRAVSVSELALSNTVLFTTNARGWKRVSMQVNFAGYTLVEVVLEGSLDSVVFQPIVQFSITETGCIVVGEVGPLAKLRIVGTGTLSGGADTLDVWLGIEKAPV